MNKKVRIITYHYVTNSGAILQAITLREVLDHYLNTYDVKLLDYKEKGLELLEFFKIFKLHKNLSFLNLKRYCLFKEFCKENLVLDSNIPKDFSYSNYNTFIVGSDNLWRISGKKLCSKFPNVYWLPFNFEGKKIAYAVSAYKSNSILIDKYKKELTQVVNSFDFIGARDRYTYKLVNQLKTKKDLKVYKVPDPTFMYRIKKTKVEDILKTKGISVKKPLVGILLYRNDRMSEIIYKYFKSQNYQVIGLSMYNSKVDINLGHILNPYEWADIFKYLDFCVTDRFHGTIFSIKNKIPFLSVEPSNITNKEDGKIYSLLKDFNLTRCYVNPFDSKFSYEYLLRKVKEIKQNWSKEIKDQIEFNLDRYYQDSIDYIKIITKMIKDG